MNKTLPIITTCSALFAPPGIPSHSQSPPPDHHLDSLSSSSPSSSAIIRYKRNHNSYLLGRSIWVNFWSSPLDSTSPSGAEIQGGRWSSLLAANLSSCNNYNHIRGARGRRIETKFPNSARDLAQGGGGSPLLRLVRMAPEMSFITETVAAADGNAAAQTGQREVKKLGAVFFDMDDTLVLTHEVDSQAHLAVMALVAQRAPHVDQSAVLRDFLERFNVDAWDPEHKVEVQEWRAGLWSTALEGQGLKDMDLARDCQSCFDRERLAGFRWTTGAEWLVRTLHQQGIKVGIITNGHPQVQRAKLKACNAEGLFDTILVGGEEPNPKPHRDIFIKACDLAGCNPKESIMVGDTLKTDIQGGINAGFLSTVWVNVRKRAPRPGSAEPDHEITTFIELQQVLEQHGVVFESSE
ncbi:unnamed protein product [Calypogeia fissa]